MKAKMENEIRSQLINFVRSIFEKDKKTLRLIILN